MAIVQTGYLCRVGPVFIITGVEIGKVVIVQGVPDQSTGKLNLFVKAPTYADQLRAVGNFQYTSPFCILGNYVDGQRIDNIPVANYKQPKGHELLSVYADLTDNNYGPWLTIAVQSSTPTPTPNPTPDPMPGMSGGSTTPVQTNPTTGGNTTVYKSATPVSQQTIAIGLGAFALLFLLMNRD